MTLLLDAILADAAARDGPDGVLLMRLLTESAIEADARAALERAIAAADPAGRARLDRLQALWAAHPQAWDLVRAVLDEAAHDARSRTPEEALKSWASVFDRLATAAPEAGVALYALGDPALLAMATQEIVTLMDGYGLLGATVDLLDLGCGIGRLVVALAPRVRSVLGVDIAVGMVAEARRRCDALANVRLLQGTGHDLGFADDASVDTVLAADVFPYLVQAGGDLPVRHLAEIARVLRPGGTALILNYSYRGDDVADGAEIASHAARAGLSVAVSCQRDLLLWDATTFLLCKSPITP